VIGQPPASAGLPRRERGIGAWVGPRAGLDAVEKKKIHSPRRKSNTGTPIVVQPVASHYTNLQDIFENKCLPFPAHIEVMAMNLHLCSGRYSVFST